jgi:peroxiredoxin Q/BCP
MTAEPPTPPVGEPAPDFKLPSTGGKTVSLDDFKGTQNVVLYFYPRDDTPGCTKEACAFRDLEGQFNDAGAAILGVSADDVDSHEQFASKFGLPFPLLADTDHAVSERYGTWKLRRQGDREWMGIERTTFLIDKAGVLRKVYPKVNVEGHVDEVLEDIKGL